jgi:hypothetical protein
LFDLAFLRAGQIFHSLLETSGITIIVLQVGFFSVLLPIISDYPSPDRTCCMEGGVSSAVAVIVHRLALLQSMQVTILALVKTTNMFNVQ